MKTSFRVGQEVVCIDDGNWPDTMDDCPNRPVKGGEYTVRGFSAAPMDGVALLLEEVVNAPWKYTRHGGQSFEPAFMAWRFRPAIERETDISELEKLLAPTSKERLDA